MEPNDMLQDGNHDDPETRWTLNISFTNAIIYLITATENVYKSC